MESLGFLSVETFPGKLKAENEVVTGCFVENLTKFEECLKRIANESNQI